MSVKLGFFTDLHLDDRPPVARTESYPDDLLAKVAQVQMHAVNRELDGVVFGADWFHRWRVSPRIERMSIEALRGWPCPIYFLLGNHDLPPELGLDRASLGTVLTGLEGDRVGVLQEKSPIIFDGSKYGVRVVLGATHWNPDIDKSGQYDRGLGQMHADFRVQAVHGMVMPPGGGWPFEAIGMDEFPSDGIDVVFVGHPHWRTGPKTVNGTLFIGPGATGRTSRSEEGRAPAMAVVELTKGQPPLVEIVDLAHRPAAEVFLELAPDRSELRAGAFAGYAAILEATTDVSVEPEEALRALESNTPERIMKMARSYLERAQEMES